MCSMLKLTLAEDSLAEYRLTGTETSPNEILAEPIGRGGMVLNIPEIGTPARRDEGP